MTDVVRERTQPLRYSVPSSESANRYDRKVFPSKNKVSLDREDEYIFMYLNFIKEHWNVLSFCESGGDKHSILKLERPKKVVG